MNPEPAAPSGAAKSAESEAFLHVLAHRTMLKAYILAIVRDSHLAEDTLSDVTLAIVRAWDNFDRQRGFAPWARGIARRVALANLRKANRPLVELDEDVLGLLEADYDRLGSETDQEEHRQKLHHCVGQLPPHSAELVRLRYFEEQSYEEIARRTERSISALYMAFSRIHQALARCVERQLLSS